MSLITNSFNSVRDLQIQWQLNVICCLGFPKDCEHWFINHVPGAKFACIKADKGLCHQIGSVTFQAVIIKEVQHVTEQVFKVHVDET